MKNKIVIITGANSGIGKAATLRFAREGYKVIMACRDIEISRKCQAEIIKITNNHLVELMELDVSSSESIQRFCSIFRSRYHQLDILIHNAAYFNHGQPYRRSQDGVELTFATNVFGPFLMTSLLYNELKKSEDPRILHAGSNIIKHFLDPKTKIDLSHLLTNNIPDSFSVYKMYAQSKMALTLLTFKMAEAFKQDGINVNALQINGAKMSKRTLRKIKPWWRLIARVQNLFFPDPAYMADKYFKICTSENFRNTTGKLFNDKLEIMQPAPKQYPGFIKQVKQVLGSHVYPAYDEVTGVTLDLWGLCNTFVSEAKDLNPNNQ
ncbi:SDR family NAD(P)-dependent oxidoreductase [Amphibacillus sediminis]|uniref:SDR family NAD(P)-dependent oxidoreductase n=1 Tax=Amphibacillus sediminis TaxID=360185 RepID=UPI00082CE1FD|nr:SDR family NAD(P)-dependent oxidoreductase [Amphibacillus sediminis]